MVSVNLDIKNPNAEEALEHLPPEQLVESILTKEKRIIEIMGDIKKVLGRGGEMREVPFGEFLKPNKRPYLLGADEDANLVGMRLYGVGPFHPWSLSQRPRFRKKSHFVIRAGDVIYNKLFAWKGTFGIVPPRA